MGKTFLLAIDAGHYMGEPGRRIPASLDPSETREWQLNERKARYTQERAAMYDGFQTIRVDDVTGQTERSLWARAQAANAAGADLYLSYHHNGGINGGNGGGAVVFCARDSSVGKPWRDELYEAIIEASGLRGNRAEPLAERNFDVLVYTKMPAVLIEFGFMDAPDDVPTILDEAVARATGYAIADRIAQIQGLELKAGFADVPQGTWFAEAVNWAVENGITQGVDEYRFCPERVCTRAEAITLIWRAMGEPRSGMVYAPLDDVRPGSWYAEAANWAYYAGVSMGTGNHEFSPDAPCARAQVITFLWRAMGAHEPDVYDPDIRDVPENAFFHKAVHRALEKGITNGVDAHTFAPEMECTRAQIVTMLYRAFA